MCLKMLSLRLFSVSQITLLHLKKYSNYRMPLFPLLKNVELYPNNIAVIDTFGKSKYKDLMFHSRQLAQQMKQKLSPVKSGVRYTVPFLCQNDASYVCVLLACWMNGSIAVPLCKDHPPSLLEYFLKDSKSSIVLCSSQFQETIQPLSDALNVPLIVAEHPKQVHESRGTVTSKDEDTATDVNVKEDGAIIIYTSGTTGPPKGVLLSHSNLHAQVNTLVKAWDWKSEDVMLHVLPLHHVHGLVNCLLCPLAVGATVVMLPKFDAMEVWKYFLNLDKTKTKVNLFSAVPTCFAKMVEKYEEMHQKRSLNPDEIRKRCTNNIRLMTCGSSALPDSVFHDWEKLTGHVLLERYGMSEIGMALSNPLNGARIPGSVGIPLPGVQTRIVKKISSTDDEDKFEVLVEGGDGGTSVCEGKKNEAGELHVKGPSIFKEYWNKPEATKKAFTKDGWFKTGDITLFDNGVYRILGRASADIINTGGYKVSALEVERYLLEHPSISDCAVLGFPDETWGEIVTAVLATHNNQEVTVSSLKEFCKLRMSSYSVPKLYKFVESVPRNVMGKVNKKDLKRKLIEEMKNS